MTEDVAGSLPPICLACGAENRAGARFCRQCGTSMTTPPPFEPMPEPPHPPAPSPSTQASRPPPQAAGPEEPTGYLSGSPQIGARSGKRAKSRTDGSFLRWQVLVPAIVGLVLLLALATYGFLADPLNLFAPTIKAYANQDLVVVEDWRAPTPKVLGHLRRGDALKGHWTDRRVGRFRWLAIEWPGAAHAFVWGHSISLKPRPELAISTPDQIPASIGTQVFAEPDETATVVDNLMPGENASIAGATSAGWVEISLPTGGVGYVRGSTFDGPVNPSAGLTGVAHYTCTLSPADSVNVPSGTPNLAFVFDANRRCIDHRYAYAVDDTGNLRRVMFNDKERRATLLSFTADRQSFARTDFLLSADDYKRLSRHAPDLANIECPAPNDPTAVATMTKAMNKIMPALDSQTAAISTNRRVWRCSAGG